MNKLFSGTGNFLTAIYVAVGIAIVLIGIDLALIIGAFSFAIIDALFGDTAGAAFWNNFLHQIPNVTKLIP